jgi:HSP20 family protein
MSESQELTVREKQELAKKEERTVPGRYFVPPADVFETDDALTIILEMPGVEKNDLSIDLEDDTLRVEGKIDFSKYEGMEPVYRVYRRALRARVHAFRKDRP